MADVLMDVRFLSLLNTLDAAASQRNLRFLCTRRGSLLG